MTVSRFEQSRIGQLLSTYSPADAPLHPLDFGDYLSLVWRCDQCADRPKRAQYYRQCLNALAGALKFAGTPLHRAMEAAAPGTLSAALTNIPYRGTRLLDAVDRKAAIAQLCHLRDNICEIGAYPQTWGVSYPGAGILDVELRERVFAVLFTALQGQYANFARLLLIIDIVLANLLVGYDVTEEVTLDRLIADFGWPDPASKRSQQEYDGDDQPGRR